MTSPWACPSCFVLLWHGEESCPRCGSAPLASTDGGERETDTEPVLLHLPPLDFPYTRVQRARPRTWVGPILLVLLALGVAVGWNPIVRAVDPAAALGGDSPEAREARRTELLAAAAELADLLDRAPDTKEDHDDWATRVRAIGARHHLGGASTRADGLADDEVRLRAAWLELLSLPHVDASAVTISGFGRRRSTTSSPVSRRT